MPYPLSGKVEARIQVYLTQSVYSVVLQKSTPAQIRQLILYISKSKQYVANFVGD
jgi:hypothetical protein